MFEIEVYYRDFSSYERTDSLGVVLNSLEEAKECLQAAKDHHEYLLLLNSLSIHHRPSLKLEEVVNLNKDKDWFDRSVDEKDWSYLSRHTFNFKGKSVSCFYEGSCSNLYSIKIIYTASTEESYIPKV